MSAQKKLLAEPIAKIRSLKTQAVVGWVYRWDNGEVQQTSHSKKGGVFYEPIGQEGMEASEAV